MERDVVAALIRVVEVKDACTAAHTWRVALYTQALAEAAGRADDDIRNLMDAAVLHDIGKIDIPSKILTKPGRLTDEEYDVIKTHTVLGYDRLVRMGETDDITLGLVRSHHERLDGSGYPDQLSGDAIPLVARWFAVIDTFDAMTSVRPYRTTVGHEAAARSLEVLQSESGAHFHPQAVELFKSCYDDGRLDWILEYYNDNQQLEEMPGYEAPVIETAGREALEQWQAAQ